MTNFDYIQTLTNNEMARFLRDNVSIIFDVITDESINCWRDDEAQALELELWAKWLNEEHEEKHNNDK